MAPYPLKFLSESRVSELASSISENLERYASGNFVDLERENGWAIETTAVTVDLELLNKLDGTSRTASADIENSLVLYRALNGMTPALARDERIWVRLAHIECLDYARARWLSGHTGDVLEQRIRDHMFAPNLTAIRDDNALSRLWWNVHIATIADPKDPEGALRLILKTADIRSNFVERTGTVSRRPLARAVVRAMRTDDWITSSEQAFRKFMIALNRNGGGVLFEALDESEASALIEKCASSAKKHLKVSAQ
ncbi:MAG: hypothetical protein D6698_02050 [Gammaproteobacteria bacterium]|nr:MAG: hypothetical protein D6698_02050 [Gammaproteobacteria bacterium]